MQDIEKNLTENYDIEIKNITPYKDAHIIHTPMGKKVLRASTLLPEKILFIHGAKEHIVKNNFKYIDRFLCSKDGLPYFSLGDTYYTVADFIEGRECDFDNRADVATASKALAMLHKASRGYSPPDGSKWRDELGKIPSYFNKRLDEIKKLKKVAKRGKCKFDYMFLEYVNYFCEIGENAIELISGPTYEKVVENSRKDNILCHHDFTHRNIICDADKAYIVNFDFCCFELKVYDVANLIRRKMRKCNWDVNEAKVIINEYAKIEPINDDEFFIMKLILQFPQKFWRVVNKYYNSKRSWSEKSYVVKLQEVVDEIEYHKKFMEKYEVLTK